MVPTPSLISTTLAILLAWGATGAQDAPKPPPPFPPGRSAHATLRGAEPTVERGHGDFREVGRIVELVLNASNVLPGVKQVSLVPAESCEALDDLGERAREIGELTIGDDGRGRMEARLGGVSVDPSASNTIVGVMLVIHATEIDACGEILAGRLSPPETGG